MFLSPLASAPAAAIAGLGSSDAGVASDFFWGLFLGVILGVPAAYLGMLLIGLPAYWVLRKLGLVRVWTFSSVGALVPLVVFANSAPLRTTGMAIAAGIAVGAVAYYLLPSSEQVQDVSGTGSDA